MAKLRIGSQGNIFSPTNRQNEYQWQSPFHMMCEMLFTFNMVRPGIFCRTVLVGPLFPYRDNDIIFRILSIDHGHTFCMWHWPIRKHFAFSRQSTPKLVALLFATTRCWQDPTRWKQLSTDAIIGFQYGLCHVVVALRCLCSSQHDEVTNKYGNQHAWLLIAGKGSEHCEQAKVFLYVEDIVNLLPTLGL